MVPLEDKRERGTTDRASVTEPNIGKNDSSTKFRYRVSQKRRPFLKIEKLTNVTKL